MNAPQASIDLIAPDTYRISVAMPPEIFPGGFSFNQYLVVDDKPLLFHTGPKKLFGLVSEQIEKVLALAQLRYIAFSHFEADECGSLPDFLARAPHGWECGYFFDRTTGTLFCGDLFTQPGMGEEPLVSRDILGPSEAFRGQMDYFSHTREAPSLIDKLARLEPSVLACMHGSAWAGDGAAMLRNLGQALAH